MAGQDAAHPEEPTSPRRGELRIYLGAAPGVGKTYAALNEAHRRLERGTDVVVGLVETHGRARTAALLEGLEVLPRTVLDHRGAELSELDVDAVLARAPEVCVVDELAHSCAPGSRHAKRWKDVEELLASGIDVISTVNVQHLESLGDVVARITGVRQRETIPDTVVRAADQIELVDITPEALRRRMAHGNIYKPEKVDASLANYFRTGNLTALRELALLWVADQVDVALQRYRSQESISEVWEARERVVVAVTGGPESATVLRRAARIARRSGSADLLCVHVLRGDGLATAWSAGPEMRRLAEDVEASFHTVVGDDVPATLLEFARTANATQLVLGTSRRSRWARAFDPGIGARTVAESGSIDVHLVTHAEAGPAPRRRLSLPARRHAWGWPAAVLLPVLATVLGVALRESVDLSTDVVLFFLATVVTAMIGGLAPALVASLGGGLLLNVFLTPPLYTLSIARPENAFAIGAMVVVALLVAAVVDRADRRAAQAATARAEATLLASFARVVLSRSDPLPKLLERVREAFGLTTVALLERSAGSGWETTACTGGAPCARPADADADVEIDEGVHLVGTGRTLTSSERALFSAVSGQALLALRNRRMAAQATDAQRRADAAGLRTALLSAVGHDLRTPLTAMKAAAGSLRDPVLRMPAEDRQELLATVEESADRLTALVDNLLDSSRLATGAVTTVTAPVGFDEVVAAALAGVHPATDRVVVEVAEDLPDVLADAGLAERVVANLVDNALRHAGGTTVAVRASAYADRVELRVVDTGPGVARQQRDLLFTPFQRLGDRRAATGVGLGLYVARGFTEAMGGTLDAEDTPGGGLTTVLSLPAAPKPALVP
jgi:two-component system sensor histidine kinase KdpD